MEVGVPISHLGDMRTLFQGIPLAEMNTSMTINACAAWLLSLTGQVNNVWWAFPIAELVSCALCTLFYLRAYKRKIQPLAEA